MDHYDTNFFEKGLDELGITCAGRQMDQFIAYYEYLVEKNKVMNLTAITEFEDVVQKHFLDSLTVVKAADLQKVGTVMDLGTGAGFPGIPLKICFPHIRMTLLDSLNKRVQFLRDTADKLEMRDIRFIHGRAEDVARETGEREYYDLCLSRAVANLSSLAEYCLPFVRVGGYFISYKSENAGEEIEAAERAVALLGGNVQGVEKFMLPCSDIGRTLVKIKKIRKTNKTYPRKAGMPSRKPLS